MFCKIYFLSVVEKDVGNENKFANKQTKKMDVNLSDMSCN